ncbi:MAG: hypothetical protein ACYTF1_21005 [Planctomycetota bacterium]
MPEIESPERYAGLYVFDFGDKVAVGYTADEVAVLLESQKYADGKVYRIHRALPDGTMELQGVSGEKFRCEDGLFFYRADEREAGEDLAKLSELVTGDPPPCRMKAYLAYIPGAKYPHLTAIVFPAEFTDAVAGWLNRIGFNGGDVVEGGISQVTDYYAAGAKVIEDKQWWPADSISRPADEVLATTHIPVQRRIA